MAEPPNPGKNLEEELHLDRICFEFERQLRTGQRPRIDSFLADCSERLRSRLLEQLLAIELEHSEGDVAEIAKDLMASFPDQEDVIRRLIQETSESIDTAKSSSAPTREVGGRFGRYRLLEKIGEGGMGVVYCAEQKSPIRRTVALKLMKPALDSDQVIARFEAERQALALMNHEHIARVFGAGTLDDGRPFFAMEYVHGSPVTEYCDTHRLPIRDRLKLLVHICRGVHHAHQKGIIHRDIKPSNVLVTQADSHAVPKVIDFGISKALGQQLTDRTMHTQVGSMIGTPAYMSPEQAGKNSYDIDIRSDVYSLGVLAYELVTGSTPIMRERLKNADVDSGRDWICEEEPEKPSTRCQRNSSTSPQFAIQRQIDPNKLGSILRNELDWIIIRALEKDRNHRYESASALADDIQRFLNDEPIQARPPSVTYKIRKFAGRNRGALATGLIILLALITATAISTWLAIDATRAHRIADRRLESEQEALEQARLALQRAKAAEFAAEMRAKELQHRVYGAVFKNAVDARERGDLTAMTKQLELCDDTLRHWEWNRLQKGRIDIHPSWIVRAHDVQVGVHQARWTPDGNGFISSGVDRLAKIWRSGQEAPLLTYRQHMTEVNGIAMSPDGNTVATIGRRGPLMVWKAASGELMWQSDGSDVWRGIDISADGNHVTAADPKSLTLWELETGDKVWTTESETELEGVRFSPDGTQILTGGFVIRDNNVRSSGPAQLWNTSSGTRINEFGSQVGVDDVTFFPSGDRIAYGTVDGRIVVHDLDAGHDALTFRARPESEEIKCVAVSSDGKWIAAAGVDREFGIWSAEDGRIACVAVGHDVGRIRSLEFHPTKDMVLSSSVDRTVRAWELTIRPPRDLVIRGHRGAILDCKFSPDARRIATTGIDGTVRVSATDTGAELLRIDGLVSESVAFDRNGERILVAADQRLVLFRATDGKLLREFVGHSQKIDTAIFSSDDKLIATCGKDKLVRIFETETGRLVHALAGHYGYSVYGLAFSPDGSRLVSVGFGEAKIWNVVDGRLAAELIIQDESFTAADFGGRNDIVYVAAHEARQVLIVDIESGRRLGSFSGHHFDGLRDIAISSDGQRLVTGDDRGGAVLWNISTQSNTLQLSHVDIPIIAVDFSPDNHMIAIARSDGTCSLMEATAPYIQQFERRQKLAQAQPVLESLIREIGDPHKIVETLKGKVELEPDVRQLAMELATTTRFHEAEFTSRLGEALWYEGKPSEAESLLVDGYEHLKRFETQLAPSEKFRTRRALDRLAEFVDSPSFDRSSRQDIDWRNIRTAARIVEALIADGQYAEAGIIDLFAQAMHTNQIQLESHHALRGWKRRDTVELIAPAATWRYILDDPMPSWRELDFDDSNWNSGPGPFGFGDNREATTLVRGRAAYALRHSFRIEKGQIHQASLLRLSFACDDGVAIFLNGKPLWRKNVPEGRIDFSTLALGGAEQEDFVYSHRLDVAKSLRIGKNVIAASVHQSSPSSSDLHFLLGLSSEWTAAASLASLSKGELADVVDSVERSLDNSEIRDWMELMRFALASGQLSPLRGSDPSVNWLRRARVQAALGDVNSAVEAYERGIATLSSDSRSRDDLLRERELVLASSGQEERAEQIRRRWIADQIRKNGSLRINCGGPSLTDPSGEYWHADRFCDTSTRDMPLRIHASNAAQLHCTARRFPYWINEFHGYQIPVPPGDYRIELHFAELEFSQPGQRVFDILIENESRRTQFDVSASRSPTKIECDLSCDDWLDIEFVPRTESPIVTAIKLRSLDEPAE